MSKSLLPNSPKFGLGETVFSLGYPIDKNTVTWTFKSCPESYLEDQCGEADPMLPDFLYWMDKETNPDYHYRFGTGLSVQVKTQYFVAEFS